MLLGYFHLARTYTIFRLRSHIAVVVLRATQLQPLLHARSLVQDNLYPRTKVRVLRTIRHPRAPPVPRTALASPLLLRAPARPQLPLACQVHQESLSNSKAYAFLACLLHYNLSVAHTIQFLGNNYTGAYHDIASIVASLCAHSIAETLITHYSRIMMLGCPNHLNAAMTCDNALLYWRKGNHPSIRAKLGQVMATMNKEERNNYVLHVPHWLWRFIPHCFITPQHILETPGKKDCQIFDAS